MGIGTLCFVSGRCPRLLRVPASVNLMLMQSRPATRPSLRRPHLPSHQATMVLRAAQPALRRGSAPDAGPAASPAVAQGVGGTPLGAHPTALYRCAAGAVSASGSSKLQTATVSSIPSSCPICPDGLRIVVADRLRTSRPCLVRQIRSRGI